MVKVGFIVEGDTEKIIVESKAFQSWAKSVGLEICSPVVDAKGGGNLLPHNIRQLVDRLKMASPEHLVILTDLEDAPSVDSVKERIQTEHTNLIFVAVKAIEAWFLADTEALQRFLKSEDAFEALPEETTEKPWQRLKELAVERKVNGPGSSKTLFAKRMCNRYGFEISRAAKHPACPSVKQFHDELIRLGSGGLEFL